MRTPLPLALVVALFACSVALPAAGSATRLNERPREASSSNTAPAIRPGGTMVPVVQAIQPDEYEPDDTVEGASELPFDEPQLRNFTRPAITTGSGCT
jgi:hypothetical protein